MKARDQLELKMYKDVVRRVTKTSPKEAVSNRNGWTMLNTEKYNKIVKRADKNYKREIKREEKELENILEKKKQEEHNNVIQAAVNTNNASKIKLMMANMLGKKQVIVASNGLKVTISIYKDMPYVTKQEK